MKKQMFQGLNRISTETIERNIKKVKKDKPVRSVQNTVSNFPAEIDGLPVKRQKERRFPGSSPV